MKNKFLLLYAVFIILTVLISCKSDKEIYDIVLNGGAETISVGESFTLWGTVLPYYANDRRVLWTSNDLSVAKIRQRNIFSADIIGVSAGEATITGTTINGIEATFKVTVIGNQIITMKTDNIELSIFIGGVGDIFIVWSDSVQTQVRQYGYHNREYKHQYSDMLPHTITIMGHVSNLDVSNNQLISLDVSKNAALTQLNCSNNELISLDVSNNIALTYLDCSDNQFSDDQLNNLFGTLQGNNLRKIIFIGDNPGTHSCDRSIAENKGWVVRD